MYDEEQISRIKDITEFERVTTPAERRRAEQELLYDKAPLMVCWVNEQHEVERMNRTLSDFLGQKAAPQPQLKPEPSSYCLSAYGCSAHGNGCQNCEIQIALKKTMIAGASVRRLEGTLFLNQNGSQREVQVSITTTPLRFGHRTRALLYLEDITGYKSLETQLLQAQKMQAIGQLTGGVVHDFNNILAATLLHLKILEERRDLDPEMIRSLRELESRSQRAIGLTRQLLQFSRQERTNPMPVDITEVVAGLISMLGRLLGENIEIIFTPSADAAWAVADAGMIEQLIVNLCVNARDAMPKGGRLTLALAVVVQPPKTSQTTPPPPPAKFVRLSISDTGCGMDEATQRRAFEPFFTTKEPGRGTGLGLSTVFNIAHLHSGWVEVISAVQRGTTVNVFLPAVRPAPKSSSEDPPVCLPKGTETILLVEDDRCVRQMVCATLHRFGYKLVEASDGIEALRLWAKYSHRIDLLLTDMIMPGGISGQELAQYLRRSRPNLKVILTSGYSTALSRQSDPQSIHTRFLAKPYLQEMLIHTVRDCLDGVPQNESRAP